MDARIPIISEIIGFHYDLETYGTISQQDSEDRLPQHLHPFHQLDIFPEGGIIIHVDGLPPTPMNKGGGVFIPPMTLHGYESETTARHAIFQFQLHPTYWLKLDTPRLLPNTYPPVSLQLIHQIHEEADSDPALLAHRKLATAILCLMPVLTPLDTFNEESPTFDPWHHRICTLLEEISEAPFSPWTVSEFSRRCQVSPDHFSRLFLRIVGKSPQHFLLEARIKAAAMNIVNRQMPIKEAAHLAGYATVHSFSRAFKNVFGSGPATFRSTNRI